MNDKGRLLNNLCSRIDKFILDGHKVVPCDDLMLWAVWFETNNRIVKQETINGVKISTVFLGFDHNYGTGPPILFKTMIFGGNHDQYQERCSTWEQAEVMHKKAIELINRRYLYIRTLTADLNAAFNTYIAKWFKNG